MAQQKIRLMSESSLETAVPSMVSDALSDDDSVKTAAVQAVEDIAQNSDVLSEVYPTYPAARRLAQENRGGIVITIDDGRFDTYTIAAPIIEAYGGRMTLAITPDWLGNSNRLTVEQTQELAAKGHEMAWHGADHVRMGVITAQERVYAWGGKEKIENILQGYDDRPVSTAIFPGLSYDEESVREAYGRFSRAYIGQRPPFITNPANPDPRFLRGRFSWHTTSDSRSQRAALDLVRMAATEGSISTLYTHNLDGTGSGIQTSELEELCALADKLGVPLITARDANPVPNAFPNLNFDRPGPLESDVQYAVSGTNSQNTVEVVQTSPQVGYPGPNALRIRGDGSGNPELNIAYSAFDISSGEKNLSVSGRMRVVKNGGSGPGAYILVEQKDYLDNTIETTTGPHISDSMAWGQYRADFTPHEDATHFRIKIGSDGLDGDVFVNHLHYGPTRLGVLG